MSKRFRRQVGVYFTPGEHRMLAARAKRQGLSIPAYLRKLANFTPQLNRKVGSNEPDVLRMGRIQSSKAESTRAG